MYKKLTSLQNLNSLGLNVFNYWTVTSVHEVTVALQRFGRLTLRFDSKWDEDSLPFYILDTNCTESEIEQILVLADSKDCIVIASNGIQFDPFLKYNLVVQFSSNGDFIAEASPEKIPLRKMYNFPLLSVHSNIHNSLIDWSTNDYYGLDRRDVLDTLWRLYDLQIYRKWIECTVYPFPVGLRNEEIIFWQLN